MATDDGRLLAAVEAQFRAAAARAEKVVETPGFRVHLWTEPDVFYRHVAVPIDSTVGQPAAIRAMLAVFEAERCRPVLEYLEEPWPALGPALQAAGLAAEARLTAMVCAGAGLHAEDAAPRPWRLRELSALTSEPVLRAYLRGLHEAFAAAPPPVVAAAELARLRAAMAEGRTWITAAEDTAGQPVAGANLIGIAPLPGRTAPVAELAGVWTTAAARGRGLARSVTRALLARFFARGGGLVWLAAAARPAAGLYGGLGFRPIGHHLRYSRPAA